MNRNAGSSARRKVRIATTVAGAALLSGCVIVPVNHYVEGSRTNLSRAGPASLQIGISTREEILLSLGEPDFVTEGDKRLGYTWEKATAFVGLLLPGGVGDTSGEITTKFLWEGSFDGEGRLASARLCATSGRLDGVPAKGFACGIPAPAD
jgi:hypothetical protein